MLTRSQILRKTIKMAQKQIHGHLLRIFDQRKLETGQSNRIWLRLVFWVYCKMLKIYHSYEVRIGCRRATGSGFSFFVIHFPFLWTWPAWMARVYLPIQGCYFMSVCFDNSHLRWTVPCIGLLICSQLVYRKLAVNYEMYCCDQARSARACEST